MQLAWKRSSDRGTSQQNLDYITIELALMCHTDTVPYSIDWPQALEPHVTDGLLYGCGACDVKGFVAGLSTSVSVVSSIAASLRSADPDFQYKLQIFRQQTGFETVASSKLVRSIEAITGRAATSIPFGSEASLLAPMAEEVVVFGPGDMQTAHSNRECMALNELDEAVECLQSLMTSG
jgi:acetylornithine deacetylase/succinyl-diaminopimelate desuccinylase-like protein